MPRILVMRLLTYASRWPSDLGPAPVFPQSVTVERFNDFDRANRFTSACSPTIYRDMLIGSPYETYSFVCELVV